MQKKVIFTGGLIIRKLLSVFSLGCYQKVFSGFTPGIRSVPKARATFAGVLFSGVFIINCSLSPLAPNPVDVEPPVINGVVSKNPNTNFTNQLKLAGIILSSKELALIEQYKAIKPNGEWAAAEGTQASKNLTNNYQEFKQTFAPNGPTRESDYLSQAIQFANSANLYARYYFDTTFYKKRNKILVIKSDIQTKEFILIYIDGRISNYQLAGNIIQPRYILIPEN